MKKFTLKSSYKPTGDQPRAIETLVQGIRNGLRKQTLLGVTGSGKTFTMANVIEQLQRPTLILAHNKTLAAQLFNEFKDFFPDNAVEYFVSYYDYYQPEAYIARTDTYIEKDSSINDEIDRLRNSATSSVMTRRDVIVIASVSCIYGLGSPEEYQKLRITLQIGKNYEHHLLQRHLIDMQYERNDTTAKRGLYRKQGDILEIIPVYGETTIRLDFWGNQLEKIFEVDSLTGEIITKLNEVTIYPAKHFVTSKERLLEALKSIKTELEEQVAYFKQEEKFIEAQRLEQRTRFDMEMLQETGTCKGIENYSRHLDGRKPGEPPYTLLDYFPDDFLLVVDESHISLPQVRGMYAGDRSRKENLIQFGFRLPSARDNRPLTFEEFENRTGQTIYISATPGDYEKKVSKQIVEQLIRPTGLLDPLIDIRPTKGQISDLLKEIQERVEKRQRVLVTTLTKKMAEDLTDFLLESGIKVNYLHFGVDTLERVDTLRDLRLGVYDVVVGINLLREGLDLPEVSLVAILDADKEGFLRSATSLIQTIGRAARHVEGKVIMYADKETHSMSIAKKETQRRRREQELYNKTHGITPKSITKIIHDSLHEKNAKDVVDDVKHLPSSQHNFQEDLALFSKKDLLREIKKLEKEMYKASEKLHFEEAALLRDEIRRYRSALLEVDI